MLDEKWRDRLARAIDSSGKSRRAISIAAGMGPGYVHSILKEGKDPTIGPLLKICDEVNVSLTYIVYGYSVSAEDEEFLQLLANSSDSEKAAILTLLRSRSVDNS